MSTTIDERVVEMRFDNQNFEKNVGHTMSTLEKLKQKLNLTGASKGLEGIDKAARNVNMNGLGSAVETVSAKFSALQVVGVTALARITNQAMATGERMIKALTIDPVKTGFQEYETQINSVQTILSNTRHNGTTIDQVNEALEELNKYADMTIYNFTEMTRNIGTFTAAGVDLETSVDSIKGIANLAAVSGSTSQQASTAMYQLSQALAAGKVSLMDWNSVVNAGMGGKVFQDALLRTSELLKTGGQEAVKTYGSFRESLTRGEWLTTEVLTETLKQFAGAYSEAELIQQGFTEQQAKEIAAMAKDADEAATKVKTFTQLWDVMKEAAQSGWSQTWKLIIGDYEQAKSLLTPISDFFTGVINSFSEARNAVLESALGKSFKELGERVNSITKPIEKSADSIKGVVKTVEDYANVVNEIIRGDWGNGQARWDKLTEAGYDWAHAQNLVNEKLGSSVRRATDYKEAQNEVTKSTEELKEENAKYIAGLAEKSTKDLRAMGLTYDQIAALKYLAEQSEKTGIPLEDLIQDIDLLNGRTLMINSFKNVGQSIVNVFRAMKTAWEDIFPPKSTEQKAQALYDIIAAFHKFTTALKLVDDETGEFNETGQKLVRIFKGIFAIVDVVSTILGGGLKIAFKLLSAVLEYFDMDILGLLANVGDLAVAFRDWMDDLLNFDGIVSKIIPMIVKGATAIGEWVMAIKEMPAVQNTIATIKDLFNALANFDFSNITLSPIINAVKDAFTGLKNGEYKSIGEFIWDGLILGLVGGSAEVIATIAETAKALIAEFKDIIDSHSPSKVFIAIGGFIISGLIIGIKEGIIDVPEVFKDIINAVIDTIKSIDIGAVMAIVFGAGMLKVLNTFAGALENFSAPFAGIGDILENVAGVVETVGESFAGLTKALKFSVQMKAIRNMAVTIGILAGVAVAVGYFGKEVGWKNVWAGFGLIAALAVMIGGLAVAVEFMSKSSVKITKAGVSVKGMTVGLLGIAAAIGILALVVKLISTIPLKQAIGGFIGLVGLMGAILGFVYLLGIITKGGIDENIGKLSGMMFKMGIAMALMVGVCKLISKLDWADMGKAAVFMGAFIIFTTLLGDVARFGTDNFSSLGGMMIKMAIAVGLMVFICKMVGKLDPVDAIAGFIFVMAFSLFVKSLVNGLTVHRRQKIAEVSKLLISISFAMMLMVGVCKLVGKLSADELVKGGLFVAGFMVMVYALVQITKIGNNQQMAKISGTILAMAAAIAILAVVCIVLSAMDVAGLAKGVIAVGFLSLFMMGMIKALKGVKNAYKSIMMMAIAIGVLALAIGLLSLIDPKKLIMPTIAMGALMGMFAVILKSSKKVTKSMGTLIVMTVAIGLMAVIVGVLGKMQLTDALPKALAISALMLAMAGVLYIIGETNVKAKDVLKAMGLLLAMTIPMMAFVAILYFMPDVTTANKKIITLAAAMTSMTGLLAALSFIGKSGMSALKGIGLLTAMVIPMMAFVAVIHFMPDISGAKDKIILLTATMVAMTVLLGILTIIGNFGISAIVGVGLLSAMILPMALFIAGLYTLQYVDVSKEKVLLLVQVMVAMTGLLAILTVIGLAAPMAIAGIVALTLMVIPMAAFTLAMAYLPDITAAQANIMLIINIMSVMTLLLAQLAMIGPMALVGVAAIAGLTAVMVEVAIFAAALAGLNALIPDLSTFLQTGLDLMIQIAGGIGEMIGAFIGGALSQIAADLPVIGMHLSQFMVNVTPFIMGARLVDETVMEGVKRLAGAILLLTAADFISSLVQGIDGIASLPELGTQLSQFMVNALPFITTAKMIDPTLVESAKSLAEIILVLTAADLISGIASLIPGTGGVNFETLGSTLKTFAEAVVGFSDAITAGNGINPEAIDAAVKAGELMIKLQNALPRSGGWVQDIIGEKDLDAFSASCIAFGQAMIEFSNTIVDGGGIDAGAIEDAATAGDLMSKLQSSLPRSGGWIQSICGEQDLVTFGASCVAFGEAITAFSKAIVEGGGVDVSAAEDAADAGEIMIALQDALPRTGGWIQDIVGAEDLGTFGESIKAFGEAITTFSTGTTIDEDAVTKANNAGQMMIALQDAIPESKWFDGKMDLEDFGKKIVAFGEKMAAYSNEVTGMDTDTVDRSIAAADALVDLSKYIANMDEIDTSNFDPTSIGSSMAAYNLLVKDIDMGVVTSSIASAKKLVGLISTLVGLDTSGISKFKVKSIGTALNEYDGQVKKVSPETINASIGSAKKMVSLINSMVGIDDSGVSTFKTAISELSTVSFKGVEEAFAGAASKLVSSGVKLIDSIAKGMKSRQGSLITATGQITNAMLKAINAKISAFATAGRNLMGRLITGINTQKAKTGLAVTSALSSAIASARNQYMNFYSAGSFLVDGFASGISANSYKAAAKAKAMAKAAYDAAKEELKINSPSKIFRALALSVPEGFAMGIDKGGDMVTNSAVTMSDTAINSVRDSLSRMYDVINGNVDARPTITPILDLSNVRSGASSIASMLGSGTVIGASANVSGVSAMMSNRNQNGGNADIVSAIDKLRSGLSNVGGNTYNVNGITYDDGSNIAIAVESLTRAAKIERRI